MVKTLFNLESFDGAIQIGTTDLYTMEDSKGYRLKVGYSPICNLLLYLQSISLYVYTVDLAIESIDKKDFTLEIPPDLHVCTNTTTMDVSNHSNLISIFLFVDNRK